MRSARHIRRTTRAVASHQAQVLQAVPQRNILISLSSTFTAAPVYCTPVYWGGSMSSVGARARLNFCIHMVLCNHKIEHEQKMLQFALHELPSSFLVTPEECVPVDDVYAWLRVLSVVNNVFTRKQIRVDKSQACRHALEQLQQRIEENVLCTTADYVRNIDAQTSRERYGNDLLPQAAATCCRKKQLQHPQQQ